MLTIGGSTCGLPAWCSVEPWEVTRYSELAKEVRRQLLVHVSSLNVLVAAIQAGILPTDAHKGISGMYGGHFMEVIFHATELASDPCI